MLFFGKLTKEKVKKTFDKCAKTGNFDKAIKQSLQLLEDTPDDHEMLNDLGYLLTKLGRHDEAIPHLKRATEVKPNDSYPWCNLGRAYLAAKRYDEAMGAFDRAEELDANDPEPGYNKTICLRQQEKMAESFNVLKAHIDRFPTYAPALSDYGLHLDERGDLEAAIKVLRKAVECDPGHVPSATNFLALLATGGRRHHQEMTEQVLRLQQLGVNVGFVEIGGRRAIMMNGGPLCEINTED